MKKTGSIHQARTIMFSELEKVMDFSVDNDTFFDSLENNVFGKKSSDGVRQTGQFLRKLYGFDVNNPQFAAFKYFWKITESDDKKHLAFLYAVTQDDYLAESIPVLQKVKPGHKVSVELFEELIGKYHPNKYSPNTRKSMAQNIASSWKQAGFIEGKVRNIRVEPEIGYKVACFAFLLAYLQGDRGDYIWNSIPVKSLNLPESRLRELAAECAKYDLMQYNHAGSITSIGFKTLLQKIGLNGNSH